MSKTHIKYFDVGAWPVYFGFTHKKKEYDKEMKRLGIKSDVPFVSANALATTHVLTKKGHTTIIVCIKKSKKFTRNQLTAALAHEAAHVWEAVVEAMRGHNPGDECQAYGIQYATLRMADRLWSK